MHKKDNMSAMTESRSSSDCGECGNLISNGDFSDHYLTSIPAQCTSGFSNNGVVDWSAAFGTPDLYMEGCCFYENSYTPYNKDIAIMETDPAVEYTEGILQSVNILTDEDVVYNLCFDAMGSTTLNVVLTTSFSPTTNTTYNYPSFGNHQILFDEMLNPVQEPCDDSFDHYSVEFEPGRPYQQLILYPLSGENAGTAIVDNIQLTCRSTYLEGILYSYNGCEFKFEPKLSGQIDIDEVHWDFGDSNTSNVKNPEHIYDVKGEYIVTLTIIDTRGCCSKTTTRVECKDVVECLTYQCWEEFLIIECANSVTLQLPGNVPEIVVGFSTIYNAMNMCNDPYLQNPIPSTIDITEGFCEIAIQIKYAIEALGYLVDFEDSNAIKDCTKGGSTPIPGFFFTSQVKVISVNGDDCNGQNGDSVPFTPDPACE